METKNELFWTRFRKLPVVGIARNIDTDNIEKIIPLYINAGFQNIEITMNSAGASKQIETVREQWGASLNIGAGTVCTMADLEKALGAGAAFIVTPIVNEQVIRACKEAGIPVFPGALSATEIYKAWESGADMVKLFPYSGLQPAYIKDISGPFATIKLMPTGGIGMHNCAEVFKAGAAAVGVGGQLFDSALIANKNWQTLTEHFNAFAKTVSQAIIH